MTEEMEQNLHGNQTHPDRPEDPRDHFQKRSCYFRQVQSQQAYPQHEHTHKQNYLDAVFDARTIERLQSREDHRECDYHSRTDGDEKLSPLEVERQEVLVTAEVVREGADILHCQLQDIEVVIRIQVVWTVADDLDGTVAQPTGRLVQRWLEVVVDGGDTDLYSGCELFQLEEKGQVGLILLACLCVGVDIGRAVKAIVLAEEVLIDGPMIKGHLSISCECDGGELAGRGYQEIAYKYQQHQVIGTIDIVG